MDKTLEQVIEGIINTKLKTINPDQDDIIVIQFPSNLSFEICQSAYKYVERYFPKRKVVAVRDDIDINYKKGRMGGGLIEQKNK